ncbi:MAG: hypothetical protein ABI690_29310 [Chloroflexota bacterium]
MFKLENKTAYHWFDVFVLLSLDNINPLLEEIGFPLKTKASELSRVAQEFVLEFYNIRSLIYIAGTISENVSLLFEETYNKLVTELGEEDATLLYEWGNQLLIDARLEYTVGLLWDIILFAFDPEQYSRDANLPALPEDKLKTIELLVAKYKNQLKTMHAAVDKLDEEPKNATESQTYHRYNTLGDERNISDADVSPLDILANLIIFGATKNLLTDIKKALSVTDLQVFEKWIESQRAWEKAQARPENLYHKPLSLSQVLEFIH